jgi:hypothetical protein
MEAYYVALTEKKRKLAKEIKTAAKQDLILDADKAAEKEVVNKIWKDVSNVRKSVQQWFITRETNPVAATDVGLSLLNTKNLLRRHRFDTLCKEIIQEWSAEVPPSSSICQSASTRSLCVSTSLLSPTVSSSEAISGVSDSTIVSTLCFPTADATVLPALPPCSSPVEKDESEQEVEKDMSEKEESKEEVAEERDSGGEEHEHEMRGSLDAHDHPTQPPPRQQQTGLKRKKREDSCARQAVLSGEKKRKQGESDEEPTDKQLINSLAWKTWQGNFKNNFSVFVSNVRKHYPRQCKEIMEENPGATRNELFEMWEEEVVEAYHRAIATRK